MKRPQRLLVLVLMTGVFSLTPLMAQAATLSNLGQATTDLRPVIVDFWGEPFMSPACLRLALPFTTGADGASWEFTSATLSLSNYGYGYGNFRVSLQGDTGGSGPSDGDWTVLSGAALPNDGLNTYVAPTPIALQPNTTYWIVADISQPLTYTGYGWNSTSSTSEEGPAGWSIGDEPWSQASVFAAYPIGLSMAWSSGYYFGTGTPQMSIHLSAIPEPTTFLLVALSGLVLLRLRSRRG